MVDCRPMMTAVRLEILPGERCETDSGRSGSDHVARITGPNVQWASQRTSKSESNLPYSHREAHQRTTLVIGNEIRGTA